MLNPFRTKELAARYDTYRKNGGLDNGCVLCQEKEIDGFVHWRIIPNKFPYDRVAAVHHMIVPRRHVTDTELTQDEQNELMTIKHSRLHEYQYLLETTNITKSVPAHYHLHLIVTKEIEC
jgi:diadenosine tetraphosphate (Ap4A) HIT family hydrolase